MSEILGRKREKEELQKILDSETPSFLAIYGRRRIGKTYLIKNFFKNQGLFFHLTGIQDATLEMQLRNFTNEFSDHFEKGKRTKRPSDWFEAFQMLRKEIEKLPKEVKKILFLDELPWLVTPRSNFMQALEHLWNRYLSETPHVILVVCGSAASWMIDHIVNNQGGLYGRVTKQIRLLPFSLSETEEFLRYRNIHLERKQVIEIYMCLGGIAKYLTYLERGKSPAQMIGELCFSYNAPLLSEFHNLYRSLFVHHEDHVKIVKALGAKRSGLSYQEIVKKTKIQAGGTLSRRLEELAESGFIQEIPLFGKGEKSNRYVLIDEYSLFYLYWISGISAIDLQTRGPDYWMKQRNTQSWKSWAGFSFENICLKHIDKIKSALGLAAVQTEASKWRSPSSRQSKEEGTEIDLVISRADPCINLCEIKYYEDVFSIDKEYAQKLQRKKALFASETKTRKALFLTLITTYGTKHNEHFLSSVDQELDFNALF